MQRTELIPPQFREGAVRMAEAFRHVDQVIVAAHVNPDGDAAGAVAAAGHILQSMGKEFMLYAQPGLPGYLDFFSTPGFVHTTLEHPPFKPRCAVLLDCGEPERLGRELAGRLPDLQTLNIDHHLGGNGMLSDLEKKLVRARIVNEGTRIDGRDTKTVRPIQIQTGLLPRAHGSALFRRGETKSMVVTTLGSSTDEQRMRVRRFAAGPYGP